jgi:hypothetical protein
MVRNITLSNQNACNVNCRFRIEGPYRIKQIIQAGRHPVNASKRPDSKQKTRRPSDASPSEKADALAQLFVVPKRETVTLLVEFVPERVPASEWTEHKVAHNFRGDLIVEYPHDTDPGVNAPTDLQRIHLLAISRRPAVKVTLVPHAGHDPPRLRELAHHPPWREKHPVLVEFGYQHIEAAMKRVRVVLVTNETPITARWRLLHVGRKRRPAHDIGNALREEEDFRALDCKDVFEFDVSEGVLQGPSKDGLIEGTHDRQPHWCPVPKAQKRGIVHEDNHMYEPQRIEIVFRPTKNELYKSHFRLQVEGGPSTDFICRGCGSYDEEDDNMDFQEA